MTSEHEHAQREEETPEEREETMKDLDVPEEQGEHVTGGIKIEGIPGESGDRP